MDCAVVEQLVLSTANVAKSRHTIIILSIIIRLARSAAAALHVQLITMIVIARGIGFGGEALAITVTCACLFSCLHQCALNCLIIVNFVCFRVSLLSYFTHARTHTHLHMSSQVQKEVHVHGTALYTYPNQPGEALYFRGRACPLRLLPFQGKLYHPIHDEETRGKAKMKSIPTSRIRKP